MYDLMQRSAINSRKAYSLTIASPNSLCPQQLGADTGMRHLQASLDIMPMLDLNVARGLLLAVWPVCLSHTSAKDQLISILRKAMFKPDQDTRLLAVHGFLFAVLQELQSADTPACPQDDPSLSQVFNPWLRVTCWDGHHQGMINTLPRTLLPCG